MASSAAAETPHTQVSPHDGTSPSNGADNQEEWSGEDDADAHEDWRKPKRQKTSRPISVSCERCKERKVSFDGLFSTHQAHVIIAYLC